MSDSIELNVGQTIRQMRTQQGLSLRDLADQCGLSINAISKIERGENSPTVASLHRLASALGVHITAFFRQQTHQYVVFVKADQLAVLQSEDVIIESLGAGLPYQQLEPFKMIIAPKMEYFSDPVTHAGEEFVYCLKGQLEYKVGKQSFCLQAGDRLLFKATHPHCWRNKGIEAAEVLLVLQVDQNQPLPHKIH